MNGRKRSSGLSIGAAINFCVFPGIYGVNGLSQSWISIAAAFCIRNSPYLLTANFLAHLFHASRGFGAIVNRLHRNLDSCADGSTLIERLGAITMFLAIPSRRFFFASLILVMSVTTGCATAQVTPTINWSTPAGIQYGTALSSTQLDATATYNGTSVPGTFAYTPAAGTVLNAGTQNLSVVFTPSNPSAYNSANGSTTLVVKQATPWITWSAPASIAAGTTLSSTQLNATSVAGTIIYDPPAGTAEWTPGNLTLTATLIPTDTTNYTWSTRAVTVAVTPATTYSWTNVAIEGGGYVDGLYFHPGVNGLQFAKTDVGGVYKWSPGATQWTPLMDWVNRTDSTFHTKDYMSVNSLAFNPYDGNGSHLYLAAGVSTDGNGFFLNSQDGGSTFTVSPLPFAVGGNDSGRGAGERLAVDPNLTNTIYFGTKSAGLWSSGSQGLATSSSTTWVQNTNFPALCYTTTSSCTTNGQGLPFVVPVRASGPYASQTPVIFVGAAEETTGGSFTYNLYETTNGGSTWSGVNGGSACPTTVGGKNMLATRGRLGPGNELYVTYNNALVPGGGATAGMICAYQFTNAGAITSVTNITPTLPSGFTGGFGDVEPDPELPGTLVASTANGNNGSYATDLIFRTTNDGASWVSMTNDTHPTGLWSDGSTTNPNGNWINLAIDPFNSNHAIYATGKSIFETTDLTNTNTSSPVDWTHHMTMEEETVVESLVAPPSGNVLLYSGTADWGGFEHTSLTTPPSSGIHYIMQWTTGMDFAESVPSTVVRVGGTEFYVPYSGGYGGYTTDGGNTWTWFYGNPYSSGTGIYSGSIAISPNAAHLVWAPYDIPPLYSSDNGAHWTASSGLPSTPTNLQVVSDRVSTSNFYISYTNWGTGSIYVSTNDGVSFTAIPGTAGLPTGSLFASFAAAGDIWLAAPFGGLWRNNGSVTNITMTKVSGFSAAYLVTFGAPKPGSGQNDTVYVYGNMNGSDGVYRSTDGGTTWIEIDDQQHRFGYLDAIAADRRTFGTIYLGTGSRGVVVGTSTN